MQATIIYGPSGSGKSTLAKELVYQSFPNAAYQLERDKIRFEVMGLGDWTTYSPHHITENIVDAYWKHAIVWTAGDGADLFICDTHCKQSDRNKTVALLEHLGYTISMIRMDTPLKDCISQDAKRGNMSVGEEVIRRQYEHFVKGGHDDPKSSEFC